MLSFQKEHPNLTILIVMIIMVVFLWGMAYPLALAPEPIGSSAVLFAEGTRVTIMLTVLSGFAGLIIGVLVALGKISPIPPIRWFCDFYLWIIRGTPLILQILTIWSIIPRILPEGVEISDFYLAVIALSLNIGAYNSECVRAGILAVPHGQIEAAKALGLKPLQTFFDIIFPQSMRVALPSLANNLASLVKDSSLAYAISVVELTTTAYRLQARTYDPIPIFITSGIIYLILTTAFTTVTNTIEQKLDVGRKR